MSQRASASYEAEVRALLMEKQEYARGAADAIASAAARVESLESKFSTQVRLLSRAKSDGLDEEPFFDELRKVQQRLNAAREEVEKAEEFARSREETWERLAGMTDETRNLAETWERVGLEERHPAGLVGSRRDDRRGTDPGDAPRESEDSDRDAAQRSGRAEGFRDGPSARERQ